MKKFSILLAFVAVSFIFSMNAQAQTADTVCVNSAAVPYSVTNTSGSSYVWTLSGGGALSSSSGNSTSVNWGGTAGTYTLQVQETASTGCQADVVSLNVVVIPLITASISGNATMCYSDPAPTVTIALTGVGPYTFTYTNGSGNTTITNHPTNSYTFTAAPTIPAPGNTSATTTYSLVSASNKFCSGTTSGSAAILVNPKPITSAIIH